MSDYLQDPLNPQSLSQLVSWLKVDEANSEINHYIVADGSFAPHMLLPFNMQKWEPVFVTPSMEQYEELGLFICYIPHPNELPIGFYNIFEQFSGLPMFSFIASSHSIDILKRSLTWLSDAFTKDHLNFYLRIGDSRCLPYILQGLSPNARQLMGSVIQRWAWFERDGTLRHQIESKRSTALTSEIQENLKHPHVLTDQQFAQLIEDGEVDLIYSVIQKIDQDIYPSSYAQSRKYRLLKKLMGEAKASGLSQIGEYQDYVVDRLFELKQRAG